MSNCSWPSIRAGRRRRFLGPARRKPPQIDGSQALHDVHGFVAPVANITCVEIGKHSNISLRLFDVKRQSSGSDLVRNPKVGQYFVPTSTDGYVVATGFPFAREGTVLPLHIRKVEGSMPIEHVLEDVFRLTNLTWSRPEDCTRYPITIKLNDRRLFEDAGQYEENEVELIEEEVEI